MKTNININDRIEWVIGTEPGGEPIGPVRTGIVYRMYPNGKHPYREPFLMAVMDRDDPDSLEALLNGPMKMAVALNNPTLKVLSIMEAL